MPDEFAAVAAEPLQAFATARDRVNDHVRISGLLAKRPNAESAIGAYFYATDENKVYESMGKTWNSRGDITKDDFQGHMEGKEADRPPAAKMVGWLYSATDTKIDYEAFSGGEGDSGVWFRLTQPSVSQDLQDTVSKPSTSGFAKLRSLLSGQFGIRIQSTGVTASVNPISRIIMQTLDASPANPYVVTFDQFILAPFTGDGKFDLMEHDSINAAIFDTEGAPVGGIILATKSGFTDGITTGNWSHFAKPITSDKIYSVVFAPGTTGDGIFSISARTLFPIDTDQTPLPV